MEADSQAIAVGLGAGLGGFAGFVIVACLLWHCVCGSWWEKKKQPTTTLPTAEANGQKIKLQTLYKNHPINITPTDIKTTSSNFYSR